MMSLQIACAADAPGGVDGQTWLASCQSAAHPSLPQGYPGSMLPSGGGALLVQPVQQLSADDLIPSEPQALPAQRDHRLNEGKYLNSLNIF